MDSEMNRTTVVAPRGATDDKPKPDASQSTPTDPLSYQPAPQTSSPFITKKFTTTAKPQNAERLAKPISVPGSFNLGAICNQLVQTLCVTTRHDSETKITAMVPWEDTIEPLPSKAML